MQALQADKYEVPARNTKICISLKVVRDTRPSFRQSIY